MIRINFLKKLANWERKLYTRNFCYRNGSISKLLVDMILIMCMTPSFDPDLANIEFILHVTPLHNFLVLFGNTDIRQI